MSEGEPEKSRVERINARIRNNPIVAGLIVVGTIVIGIASFTDATTKLLAAVSKQSPASARAALGQMGLPFTSESLAKSAQSGDLAAVRLYLTAGMDPNPGSDQEGPLANAAFKGHKDVVLALLKGGADPSLREGRRSALAYAAAGGRNDIVQILLDRKPDVATLDDGFIAATNRKDGQRSRNFEGMRLLAAKGAEVKKIGPALLTEVFTRNFSDEDAVETTKLLLDLGVDLSSMDGQDGRPVTTKTPLMGAAENGYVAAADLLVARGAKLETRYDSTGYLGTGWTALLLATRQRHPEVVSLLIGKGAEVEVKNGNGDNALLLAARSGDAKSVEAILGRAKDLEAKDHDGQTALMILAAGTSWPDSEVVDHPDSVQALLDRGARIDVRDNDGATPLMMAVESGSVAVVRALLEHGARLDDKDAHGKRAIDHARSGSDAAKSPAMMQLLQKPRPAAR